MTHTRTHAHTTLLIVSFSTIPSQKRINCLIRSNSGRPFLPSLVLFFLFCLSREVSFFRYFFPSFSFSPPLGLSSLHFFALPGADLFSLSSIPLHCTPLHSTPLHSLSSLFLSSLLSFSPHASYSVDMWSPPPANSSKRFDRRISNKFRLARTIGS